MQTKTAICTFSTSTHNDRREYRMKKKGLICLCLAACLLAAAGLAGCGGGEGNIRPISDEEMQGITDLTMSRDSVAESGINIIENGGSKYSILIPADASGDVLTASRELQLFLQESSGAQLPVVTDADMEEYDTQSSYISLGDTFAFAQSGIEVPASLKTSGYILKRVDNTLFVAANGDFGVVCGVYDMLYYTIGYECYASDEIYYEEMSTVPLLDFNLQFTPLLDIRTMNIKEVREDDSYRRRLRLQHASNSWAAKGHTSEEFLPIAEYQDEHPDWYGTTGGDQLCFGCGLEENGDVYGMKAQLIENMKEAIESAPNTTYIQIGINDNWTECACKYCTDAKAKYGNYAGLQLQFTNEVAEEIDAWLAETAPEREMNYVFFAYQQCESAPVRYDEASGKYVPISADFSLRDNVYVYFCPISMDNSKPLDDPANTVNYNLLIQWRDLLDYADCEGNIIVWSYSTAAYAYFLPLYNFGSAGETFRVFAENGVDYIYDQASGDSNIPCFQALKIYTQTKMMYYSGYSYDQLVADFMTHYYGEASEQLTEYYNFIRAYYKYLEVTQNFSGTIFFQYVDQKFWPSAVCDKMIDILDRALEAIEPLKATDEARYKTLYDRIKRERLSPIYLMFQFYMDDLTQEQKEEYYGDMAKYTRQFGIEGSQESAYNMAAILEEWESQIFN